MLCTKPSVTMLCMEQGKDEQQRSMVAKDRRRLATIPDHAGAVFQVHRVGEVMMTSKKVVHYVDSRGARFDEPYSWQQFLCRSEIVWDGDKGADRLGRTENRAEVTCKRCLSMFERAEQHERHCLSQIAENGIRAAKTLEQDEVSFDIWYFVDHVLEGRQGAARGGSIEPLMAAA